MLCLLFFIRNKTHVIILRVKPGNGFSANQRKESNMLDISQYSNEVVISVLAKEILEMSSRLEIVAQLLIQLNKRKENE